MLPFIPGEFTLELADVILMINAIAIALIAAVTLLPELACALSRLRERLRPRPPLGP
jgi:hypothetical protein